MSKLLILNGSPRPRMNTYNALMEYKEYLKKQKNIAEEDATYLQIPYNLNGCVNCDQCNPNCNIEDQFQNILKEVEKADYIILGTPVYLDMPTAQTVALLTRLNCRAESTGREFFRNKKIYLLATSYCSGTKVVINTMMSACEMLGFSIEGRSTREYVWLWKDKKIRGGMDSKKDAIFLQQP